MEKIIIYDKNLLSGSYKKYFDFLKDISNPTAIIELSNLPNVKFENEIDWALFFVNNSLSLEKIIQSLKPKTSFGFVPRKNLTFPIPFKRLIIPNEEYKKHLIKHSVFKFVYLPYLFPESEHVENRPHKFSFLHIKEEGYTDTDTLLEIWQKLATKDDKLVILDSQTENFDKTLNEELKTTYCLLQPYKEENDIPIYIQKAIFNKIPVITNNTKPYNSVVSDKRFGLIFNDYELLKTSLDLIKNEEVYKTLRNNCKIMKNYYKRTDEIKIIFGLEPEEVLK